MIGFGGVPKEKRESIKETNNDKHSKSKFTIEL